MPRRRWPARKLVAPFDGTILETNVNAGDQVSANTTILTLANLKTLQVVASVDETTIRQVSAGQTATHHLRRLPGPELHRARCWRCRCRARCRAA